MTVNNCSRMVARVLVSIVFISSSNAVYAISTKDACQILRQEADQIQSQLPLNVDHVTELVGVAVLYTEPECFMTYTYIVSTRGILEEMRRENGLSLIENLDFLRTEEGYSILKSEFQFTAVDASKLVLRNLRKIRDMKLIYNYKFDEGMLPSIATVVLDTTN